MKRLWIAGFLVCLWTALLSISFASAHRQPDAPLGRHCVGVGPIALTDPEFCGCTWGVIYYRGEPVTDAIVQLHFGNGFEQATSQRHSPDEAPFFSTSAVDLGAKRGDILTLTVAYAGQTITRTLRAWPEAEGEQQVPIVLTEDGVWSPWLTGGYTQALTLDNETLWAGGASGLLAVNLTTGISTAYTLPFASPAVRALVHTPAHHLWVAGTGGVAKFDGANWQSFAAPISGDLLALAYNPISNTLWLGGGTPTTGQLAYYDGTWHTLSTTFGAPIVALAVDGRGDVWASVRGRGVVRQQGSEWVSLRVATGFVADYIHSIVSEPNQDRVWFGARPALAAGGVNGGIARYDLTSNTLAVYTLAHGLPADVTLTNAPADIFDLAFDPAGTLWAATAAGVYRQTGTNSWAANTLLPAAPATGVVAAQPYVVASTAGGLNRLESEKRSGSPPVAQITTSAVTVTLGQSFTLAGTGVDNDEGGNQILIWEWMLGDDKPLCTTANTCQLPATVPGSGVHLIKLRVQDDEGVWSQPVTARLTVTEGAVVYLPTILRGTAASE